MYNIGNSFYSAPQHSAFSEKATFTPHRGSTPNRMLTLFCVSLLASGALAASSTPSLASRLKGGPEISWKPDTQNDMFQKFGPFLSSELKCHLQNQPVLPSCSEVSTATSLYEKAILREIPTTLLPYVEAVSHLVPFRDSSLARFPKNFEAFVFNEVVLVGNGNRGCVLKQGLGVYSKCKKAADSVVEYVKSNKLESSVYDEDAFYNKGFGLMWSSENNNIHVLLSLNPDNSRNYKAAMNKVTEEFLQEDCFFTKSEETIIKFIKETHELLMKSLPANDGHSQLFPGTFRKKKLIVYKPLQDETGKAVENNLKDLLIYLRKKGASESELKDFRTAYGKIMMSEKQDLVLTGKEAFVVRKVAFLPALPKSINSLMNSFVSDFKKYAQQDMHPVALAAWVHCEIGRIHPFSDGNGRLARLLMNAILVRGGYKPVIIPDDSIYTEALFEDEEQPGAFARYLANLITEQALL